MVPSRLFSAILIAVSFFGLVERLAAPASESAFPSPIMAEMSRLHAAELSASRMQPSPESAMLTANANLTLLGKDSRLVTDESAEVQVHFAQLTFEHWHRLAFVPSAPFSQIRSLPLLV
jgi:hypothetical protein